MGYLLSLPFKILGLILGTFFALLRIASFFFLLLINPIVLILLACVGAFIYFT
tara:strand:+ start:518 stop:676 length:159 start_codon:yes stop_codon:yes gene_type:complete